jgi:hypothetical protein
MVVSLYIHPLVDYMNSDNPIRPQQLMSFSLEFYVKVPGGEELPCGARAGGEGGPRRGSLPHDLGPQVWTPRPQIDKNI